MDGAEVGPCTKLLVGTVAGGGMDVVAGGSNDSSTNSANGSVSGGGRGSTGDGMSCRVATLSSSHSSTVPGWAVQQLHWSSS